MLGSDSACGVPGSNWVDPPKRERKRVVNYAENEYFRQAMKSGSGPRGAGVKFPKMPQLQVTPAWHCSAQYQFGHTNSLRIATFHCLSPWAFACFMLPSCRSHQGAVTAQLTSHEGFLLRPQSLQDFQFFNTSRLTEIFNKEAEYEKHMAGVAEKERAARAQVASAPSPLPSHIPCAATRLCLDQLLCSQCAGLQLHDYAFSAWLPDAQEVLHACRLEHRL